MTTLTREELYSHLRDIDREVFGSSQRQDGEITTQEYANAIGISVDSAGKRLKRLVALGLFTQRKEKYSKRTWWKEVRSP